LKILFCILSELFTALSRQIWIVFSPSIFVWSRSVLDVRFIFPATLSSDLIFLLKVFFSSGLCARPDSGSSGKSLFFFAPVFFSRSERVWIWFLRRCSVFHLPRSSFLWSRVKGA
jgi:hypothetical protein